MPPNLCGSANRPHLIGQTVSLRDATPSRKLNIDMIVALLCIVATEWQTNLLELKNPVAQLSVRPTQLNITAAFSFA